MEPARDYSAEFSTLLKDASVITARRRIGDRLMTLTSTQRSTWLTALVQWMAGHGPKPLRPVASTILKEIPTVVSGRVAAVRLTLDASQHHSEFRRLSNDADRCRDRHQFLEAEHAYWQALQIFPLHGGYRVQYAHMLKDQQKYADAFVNYCFALSVGAPLHDVQEHLLFAAHRAHFQAAAADVERLARAWNKAEQSANDWDAPPIYNDFFDLARLFWGNTGLLTVPFMQPYLLKCTTRKSLFISLLRSEETLRHNRLFFVMMNEKGLASV
jgi:hypothetical protein